MIVSNSSPLIALAAIGRLDLLREFFERVLIPPEVRLEVVERGAGRAGAAEIARACWIEVREVTRDALLRELAIHVEPGEAQALALACEVSPDFLLVDDYQAREKAKDLGVRVVGTVGVLVEAKRRGRLQTVKPSLDALRTLFAFRLADKLYRQVLDAAGEGSSS
ncbi:MAG: DUF3368 domain-containing protein [Planctomycetes bacterium]|nr:DUF3368 domain-containing protein [Planctomycetota bacterium]